MRHHLQRDERAGSAGALIAPISRHDQLAAISGRPQDKPLPRVAVLHQGCIPIYRRAFYERLAKIPGRQYVVLHGEPEPNTGIVAAEPPFSFPNIHVHNIFFKLFGRSLTLQSALLPVLKGHFSALVLGHEIKFISSIFLLFVFRLMGRPVVLWGHGRTNDYLKYERSKLGRWLGEMVEWFKRRLILTATGYMAYTEQGADYVANVGLPREQITVLWNTIDIDEAIAANQAAQSLDRGELRESYGISRDAIVFMFIGRIYPPKRVDTLIETAQRLRTEAGLPVEVVIVGGGPDEDALKARCTGHNWCKFLGRVLEEAELGRIFRCADAIVLPGKVGLVVNHSFAHGLPVITCRAEIQTPEVEYIKHGHNGMMLESDEGLYRGLREFATSPELRERLVQGVLETRSRLELGHMVTAFDEAVAKALETGQARPARAG
jgi:glycosyltransferase involved in cell wall biosynthesis